MRSGYIPKRFRFRTFFVSAILLNEADKILEDERATRAEKAFARIVYEIVSEWQPDPE